MNTNENRHMPLAFGEVAELRRQRAARAAWLGLEAVSVIAFVAMIVTALIVVR
jgi:hypothetical protein